MAARILHEYGIYRKLLQKYFKKLYLSVLVS